jgi:ribosomal 30S subunit maturation factor RimM
MTDNKIRIEVTEDMVNNLCLQFSDINRPEKAHELQEVRNAISMVLELLDKEPELIYDDEFYDDLTRTFAMKIALERMNCFYSS